MTCVPLTAGLYVPAGQFVQAEEPVTSLYFPIAQGKHVPPSGPVYPFLQKQAVTDEDPRGESIAILFVYEVSGQYVQVEAPEFA